MNFNGMYQPMGMPAYPMAQPMNGYAQPDTMRQPYQQMGQATANQNYYPFSAISPETDRIWVHGEKDVDKFFVAAGHSADFWDMDLNRIYVKIADQTGKTRTQILDYTLLNPENNVQPTQTAQPTANYVTRDEFNALAAKFEQFTKPTPVKEESTNAE